MTKKRKGLYFEREYAIFLPKKRSFETIREKKGKDDSVMETNDRFSSGELLRYRHVPEWKSGGEYLLVMACLVPGTHCPSNDYALRAKLSRDGMEAFCFTEERLRKKKSERDLIWILREEAGGTVSLQSRASGRYLSLSVQGAALVRKKQCLSVSENGTFFRFFAEDKKKKRYYLCCIPRSEAESGLCFTSSEVSAPSSFALLKRERGLSAQPQGPVKLTVGTFADIHVDYGLQLTRPYLRKSAIRSARGYRNRYDLDAVILCGDNISDNGSGRSYSRGGAVQGKWPYDRWVRVRNLLHKTLQGAFRNPDRAKNIFYLTGNHEYQCGDRQPAGKTYNSAYYTDLLPKDIQHPLFEAMQVGQGSGENLLCYAYRVKGYPFLVLNTPSYEVIPNGSAAVARPCPAHTMAQADWLEARLNEIEAEQGRNAVVFVSSHYPFVPCSFVTNQPGIPNNADAFVKMNRLMNRYPNLFYFYGHVHEGDFLPTKRMTQENMTVHSPTFLELASDGQRLREPDGYERGKFRSDLIIGLGFHEEYAGSMAFYKNSYFKNDGVNYDSWLSHIEVPFFQGCAIEVYDDRVVLTMQNFGSLKDVKHYLPNASYRLKPLVCPLVKD